LDIPNPKRRYDQLNQSLYFDYYASFSHSFVRTLLGELGLDRGGSVLDPWNGIGTTTTVAHSLGFKIIGFDINPALCVIAKSRLLDSSVIPSLIPLSQEIITNSRRTRSEYNESEPLTQWFRPRTAAVIRSIERSIFSILIDRHTDLSVYQMHSVSNVSSLACFFYVTLFKTARSFLSSFQSSNPTWIKVARGEDQLIELPRESIHSAFRQALDESINSLNLVPPYQRESAAKSPTIDIADSRNLPLADGSILTVITSPPYCTRIDYAVATLPELSTIGCHNHNPLKRLRDNMIGTPTVSDRNIGIKKEWGDRARHFLSQVGSHNSKASGTYYQKFFCQYFNDFYLSLLELDRVLASGGNCVIVVQDSYYKEVHNDLAGITIDMVANLGWKLESRTDFPVKSLLANVNKSSRQYRKGSKAVESVLIFCI
jgi:hypothetical protein